MTTPKESGRQRGIVKNAHDILASHYAAVAAIRQPGAENQAEGETPAAYAAQKWEALEKKTAGAAVRVAEELPPALARAGRAIQQEPYRPSKPIVQRARQNAGPVSRKAQALGSSNIHQPAHTHTPSVGHGTQPDSWNTSHSYGNLLLHSKVTVQSKAQQHMRENIPDTDIHGKASSPKSFVCSTQSKTTPAAYSGGPIAKAGTEKTNASPTAKMARPGVKHNMHKASLYAPHTGKLKTSRVAKTLAQNRAQKLAVRQAAQRARQTAKATGALAKKAGQLLVKAGMALGRALLSLASACGPVVVIIVALALIGAVIASPFGLFYAGEDEAAKNQMQETIGELAAEYQKNIRTIIEENPHDEMRLRFTNHGHLRRDNLVDSLAVYAVKTAGIADGMEVVTLDAVRLEILREVFWAMQELRFEVTNY